MVVDAGRYVRRGRRQDDRAAKERRQKQILVAGTALLAVVLAIQLPRILHRAHGGSAVPAATPVPAPSATGGPTASTAATRAGFARRLAALQAFDAKDPFVQQSSDASTTAAAPATPTAGPSVRTRHFVAKDPFVDQSSDASTTAAAPATPTAGPSVRTSHFVAKDPFAAQPADSGAAKRSVASRAPVAARAARKYVVILASIPVLDGYRVATRIARVARARGILRAGVLRSASYGTLRSGFYVVYADTYRTTNGLLRGLAEARAHGFPAAYSRPLGR